jgi:hypothetical protein
MECELTLSAQRKLNANLKELKRRKDKERFEYDFPYYAEKCLFIRPKEGGKIPLKLNKAQIYVHDKIEEQRNKTGKVRALVLKGRQQGISTYIEGRDYWKTSREKGKTAFILTHEEKATKNLFRMANRYHENCPEYMKPETGKANANELVFSDLDSGYELGTAGNKEVGRSQTVQYFHGSEVAFWKNAANLTKGVLETIPEMNGTEIIYESTANGVGNFFHQQWQSAEAGESEFIAIFVPWYWQEEYEADDDDIEFTADELKMIQEYPGLSKRNLAWRRNKIIRFNTDDTGGGEDSFKQEYPMTSDEAFLESTPDSLIKVKYVKKARKQNLPIQYSPLVIGVDPARGGDSTAFIRREGRVAYKLEYDKNDNLMHVVGLCVKIIREEMPAKMFIDVGGIGAGVYDRLLELGFRDTVVCVNFGSQKSVIDQRKYYNKRAEMWGEMKEWLENEPSQIPDTDKMQTDLVTTKKEYSSLGQTKLEAKEKVKERIKRSPDGGDALALTFAFPVANDIDHYQEEYNKPEGRNKRGGY